MDVAHALPLVKEQADAIAGITGDLSMSADYQDYRKRHAEAVEAAIRQLTEAGASIRHDYAGASIRFAGIRSTSTMGVAAALRNWLAAARKKLGNPQ